MFHPYKNQKNLHKRQLYIPKHVIEKLHSNNLRNETNKKLLQANFITYTNILPTNFEVFNNPSMLLCRLFRCSATP